MTQYFVTASVWSAIGLIVGYVIGLGQRVRFRASRLSQNRQEQLAGLGLVLIALLSTAQSLYFQNTQAAITACQAEYNRLFQQRLRERAAITERDRQNTVRMALGVAKARTSSESLRAIQEYIVTNQKLETERSQSELPSIGKDNCNSLGD